MTVTVIMTVREDEPGVHKTLSHVARVCDRANLRESAQHAMEEAFFAARREQIRDAVRLELHAEPLHA